MMDLPKYLRRMPSVFYALAVIVFIASFSLAYYETFAAGSFGSSEYYSFANPAIRGAILRALFAASIDAIWIAANGILFHFLLSFWDRFSERDSDVEAAE